MQPMADKKKRKPRKATQPATRKMRERTPGRVRPILRATVAPEILQAVADEAESRGWPDSAVVEACIRGHLKLVDLPARPLALKPVQAKLTQDLVELIQNEARARGMKPNLFIQELVRQCAPLVEIDGYPRA